MDWEPEEGFLTNFELFGRENRHGPKREETSRFRPDRNQRKTIEEIIVNPEDFGRSFYELPL
jgi:hypothetical protein